MRKFSFVALSMMAASALALSACSEKTQDNASETATSAANDVAGAASDVGDAASTSADAVGNAASKAVDSASAEADKASVAADKMGEHIKAGAHEAKETMKQPVATPTHN